ncbi:MAG: S-layer homology domain-containing protein [Clostridia bacterium]|nr:S-layer homology domain-containing protein [Clostridia bacterium]
MRKLAKFLSMVIVAATLASLSTITSSAATFTDISSKNEALQEAAEILNNLGIAKGTGEGTFSPKDKVTREQMAAFMYRLMKAGKSVEGGDNVSGFTDLKDPTFYYMISWANQSGIIKGRSATQFDPKGKITLQDCYTMMVRALGYENYETIPYPYGYINIAESLDLDKNVKDSIAYTDELTRGDVAVILYNALYAHMNETYTVNVMPPPEMYSTNTALTPMTKELPETVWHKIFNVTEVTRRVVATPNFAVDLSKIDSVLKAGNSEYAVYKPTGVEAPDVPLIYTAAVCVEDEIYGTKRLAKEENAYKFADLGLSGKADDYFLKDLTMYINPEGKVLACKADGKTGSGSISFSYLSGTDKYKYIKNYTDGSTSTTKIRNGTVGIGDAKAYFYNKPNDINTYAVTLCPTERDDDGRLTYTAGYMWYGEAPSSQFTYEFPYVEATKVQFNIAQSSNDTLLAHIASTATNSGRYFCDYFDTNGDGIIEYVNVMPMTWGQIVVQSGDRNSTKALHTGDSKYRAAWNASTRFPTIYINEDTIVEGGSYEDGKLVFAYVSGPANYVRIASDDVNNGIGNFTSTIVKKIYQKNGASANNDWRGDNQQSVFENGITLGAWQSGNRIVGHVNFERTGLVAISTDKTASDGFSGSFQSATKNVGTSLEVYHHGNQPLWAKTVAADDLVNVGEDYAIIKYADKNAGKVVFEAGGIEQDASLTYSNHVRAFIGGEYKIVSIADTFKDSSGNIVSQNDAYFNNNNLVGVLSTYTVEDDGEYVFKPLSYKKGNLADPDDDAILYMTEVTEPVSLEKYYDILYRFVPGYSASSIPAGLIPAGVNHFKLDENFKMVVNYIDAEGYSDYAIYDYNNQPDFDVDELEFSKTIAIYRNNTESTTTEYLNFIYAEVGGELVIDRDDNAKFGIIISNYKEVDNKANVITKYTIINPMTGEEIADVATHTSTTELPKFNMYELTTEGKINTGRTGHVADLNAGSNALHTLAEYHRESGLFTMNKADGSTETVIIDADTIVAVFDRENVTYEIEDMSIFDIEYVDDTDFKYHTPGVTNKTFAVITPGSKGNDDFYHASVIIVVRG